MEWKDVDWQTLRDLRDRFLHPRPGDYWCTRKELEHYALAFAPRIGAKWTAIWEEVLPLLPSELEVWDWGCGTGVAVETLQVAAPGRIRKAWLSDRSPMARDFAVAELVQKGVSAEVLPKGRPKGGYWLLVSHVWNELDEAGRLSFWQALQGAQGFVWVEPGTPGSSAGIIATREKLRSSFTFLAPCPHQAACGLAKGARDWCHHFAPPSPEFFTSGDWVKFSKEMGIDLRSLPVTYLVARRGDALPAGLRVLGRPRVYKGYAKALVCTADGVREDTLRGVKQVELKRLKDAGLTVPWK